MTFDMRHVFFFRKKDEPLLFTTVISSGYGAPLRQKILKRFAITFQIFVSTF